MSNALAGPDPQLCTCRYRDASRTPGSLYAGDHQFGCPMVPLIFAYEEAKRTSYLARDGHRYPVEDPTPAARCEPCRAGRHADCEAAEGDCTGTCHPAHPAGPHEFIAEDGDSRCDECRLRQEEHPIAVVIAAIATAHFEFEGVGVDDVEAREALLAGLLAHGRQYGLSAHWHEPLLDDVHVRTIFTATAYRDRELI